MKPDIYRQFYENELANWWFSGMRSIFDRQIEHLDLDEPTTILDVGCGTGAWTDRLRTYGWTVGLDNAHEVLAFCRTRFPESLVQGTALELPFVSNAFSLVTAFGVIEHLDDDEDALRELLRVCRPGGYVCLLTSTYRALWSYHDDVVHHKRRYLRSELGRKVTSAGFRLSRLSYVNSLLFPAILLARFGQRLGLFRPEGRDDVIVSSTSRASRTYRCALYLRWRRCYSSAWIFQLA